MVNIKSLTLRDFGWLGTPYQNLIRDAISLTVSLSSLTSLVIQGQDFPPSGRHENHSVQLALLLRSQPLLECLELRSSEWDLQDCMLQSDVPRLSHLVAGSREARFLVCGRPITSLFIRSITREPGPDGWKALAASSAPITFLALDDMYHPFLEAALHSVAMHFKDVQKLSIQGAAYQILPLLIGGFPSFPYLRTLRLKAWDLNMEGTESIEDQRLDAIMYIRHRCPQFQNLEMDQKWI
ncbi:hypothetical protein FRB95_008738 [Tulasnella sp. JGI-2019a]|nr:hypothetical protein FRB95_008738 [Tulasnella sp. JGI-2019a]